MHRIGEVTTAAVLALILTAPGSAEARFGKRDRDDNDESVHAAVKVSAPSSGPSVVIHNHPDHGSIIGDVLGAVVGAFFSHRHHHHHELPPPSTTYVYVAPPPAPMPPAAPVAKADAEVSKSSIDTSLGLMAQAHPEGAAVGLGIATEGKRWGFNANASGIFARADGGTAEFDSIKVLEAHLTYSIISGENVRLRLEAGATSAFAPDMAVGGPDVGVSAKLKLIGPLGLEGSAHVTPVAVFFYRSDYRAAATLKLGGLGLQAGWRQTRYDDLGVLPGSGRHVDTFNGPYVGASLLF